MTLRYLMQVRLSRTSTAHLETRAQMERHRLKMALAMALVLGPMDDAASLLMIRAMVQVNPGEQEHWQPNVSCLC